MGRKGPITLYLVGKANLDSLYRTFGEPFFTYKLALFEHKTRKNQTNTAQDLVEARLQPKG